MGKKQIKINESWLKRLLELKNLIEKEQNPTIKQGWIAHLLGYISSAEHLIEK